MKRFLTLLFIAVAATANSQSIIDLQAYAKLGGTRVTTLMSDNTIWWYAEDKGWEKLTQKGLENKKIKSLSVYVRTSVGTADTRMVAVADDNTIWWYADGKQQWEQVTIKNSPQDFDIKVFTAYFKPDGMGWSGESRFFISESDGKMWFLADNQLKEVLAEGLPKGFEMQYLRTYQKYGMMGSSETRYIAVLKDNSIWWTAGKKWQKMESSGLPANTTIKLFDAYMKYSLMGNHEGRLVTVLSDNSFWYIPAQNKKWVNIPNTGLPKDYKVKLLKVYQKYGTGDDARLLIALEDDSLWWYADGKGWTSISTKGLKTSK